jgi:hypothetical protein
MSKTDLLEAQSPQFRLFPADAVRAQVVFRTPADQQDGNRRNKRQIKHSENRDLTSRTASDLGHSSARW